MRRLCHDYCHDVEEQKSLVLADVDKTEDFHTTGFMQHLSPTSEFACSCTTCGFSGVDGIECKDRHSHNNPCKECARGYKVLS
jgi:hypothetical protein